MAKKTVKTVTVEPDDKFKVTFIKNFEGCLNNRYFKNKVGEIEQVSKGELEWLSNKGVIVC